MKKEVKLYKTTSVSFATEPDAVFFVKGVNETVVRTYVTTSDGQAIPLKDLSGGGSGSGIQFLASEDSSINITGTATSKNIQVSSALQTLINSALQANDPISSLLNDSNFITLADVPTFNPSDYDLSDFTNNSTNPFVKQSNITNGTTNLGYTASSTNGVVTSDTGSDATIPLADNTNAGLLSPAEKSKIATAIQPSDLGTVATSNDYNDLDNIPSSFSPSAHTHVEADITDLDKYTQSEVDTLLGGKFNNPTGNNTQYLDGVGVPRTIDAIPTDGSNNAVSSNGVFDALTSKENTIIAGNTSQFYRGDKTFQTLDKTAVGLSNVDNTSDSNKPISIATQTALNTKQKDLFNFYTKEGFLFHEDFLGNPGTSTFSASYGLIPAISGAGATCVPTTSYPNRTNQQGVLQLGTGTTATGSSNIRLGDNNAGSIYTGNGEITMQCFYNVQTLSTITERFYEIIGFMTGANFANTNTISFTYDEGGIGNYGSASANWKCITRVSPTTTATITTVPVVASQWYVLKIVINSLGNSISFFIDNVLVATHTTNIPNLITPRIAKIKTIGTTNRNSFLDYVIIQQIYATPRTL